MLQHWTVLWRRGWLAPTTTPPALPACAHALATPPYSDPEALTSAAQEVRLPAVLQEPGAVEGLQLDMLLLNHAACSLHFDRSHDQGRRKEGDKAVWELFACTLGALGSGDARLQGGCGCVQEEFGRQPAVGLQSSCLAAFQVGTCVCGRRAWLSACCMQLKAATGHFSLWQEVRVSAPEAEQLPLQLGGLRS